MLRIRSVKPDLFQHEELYDAEKNSKLPLRLVFIGLFTCCDRAGRFHWRVRQLKRAILPYDDCNMAEILETLVFFEYIVKYKVNGKPYGYIPSWSRNQRITGARESASYLPDPMEGEVIKAIPDWINKAKLSKSNSSSAVDVLPEESNNPPKKENKANKVVEDIFSHWQECLGHKKSKLDKKRISTIKRALSLGYTASQLYEAITGCSLTPYNMGNNEQGQRYDSLDLILRDADHIDRFIHNAIHPPVPKQRHGQIQSNQAVSSWLNGKVDQTKVVTVQQMTMPTLLCPNTKNTNPVLYGTDYFTLCMHTLMYSRLFLIAIPT